jgi:hypothetical protein
MPRKIHTRRGEDRVPGSFTADLERLHERNTGRAALASLTQPDR